MKITTNHILALVVAVLAALCWHSVRSAMHPGNGAAREAIPNDNAASRK